MFVPQPVGFLRLYTMVKVECPIDGEQNFTWHGISLHSILQYPQAALRSESKAWEFGKALGNLKIGNQEYKVYSALASPLCECIIGADVMCVYMVLPILAYK